MMVRRRRSGDEVYTVRAHTQRAEAAYGYGRARRPPPRAPTVPHHRLQHEARNEPNREGGESRLATIACGTDNQKEKKRGKAGDAAGRPNVQADYGPVRCKKDGPCCEGDNITWEKAKEHLKCQGEEQPRGPEHQHTQDKKVERAGDGQSGPRQ